MTTTDVVENELETALRTVLANDATLAGLATGGVWNGAAEQGTDVPFVVFAPVDPGVHVYTFTRRAYTGYEYIVKGVTEGIATLAAGQIDRRIDQLLHDAALSVSPFGMLVCRRTRNVSYPEVDEGRTYRHRGGVYRLSVTGT